MTKYRTHNCNELNLTHKGNQIILSGWINKKRDHGNLLFIDLRDNYGLTQCVIEKSNSIFKDVEKLPLETVIKIEGKVVERSKETTNPNISTGEVEVAIKTFEILGATKELPMPVFSDQEYAEEIRLKYRFLDLRRKKIHGKVVERSKETINPNISTGEVEVAIKTFEILGATKELPMPVFSDQEYAEEIRLKYRFLDLRRKKIHQNIILRAKIISFIRTEMQKLGFLEFQTPILTSSSPEGARDFLVPSRLNPGKFYALPQAPQQFKQLIMVSGFDKYFQIAPCFRDEDARADRSPGEFYQLDLEMSFVEQEDIFNIIEKLFIRVFNNFSNKKILHEKFPRIKYSNAMLKYGSDKPDLRNPLLITDLTNIFKRDDVKFEIFKKLVKSGHVVRALFTKNTKDKPRSFFDGIDNWAKEQGSSGLAYFTLEKNDKISGKGPIGKFFSEESLLKIISETGAEVGDTIFLSCGKQNEVEKILSQARAKLADELNLIDENCFAFCWVVDYPIFERDEISKKIKFSHNPFSMPQGDIKKLDFSKPLDLKAYQYDIVCNGIELSSGAIRNHIPNLMYKLFEIAGYSKNDVDEKFRGMINALSYGAPPHGGIAPGIDRIIMLLANEKNIREVTMFPMNQNAQDLMMNAPSNVNEEQLKELNLSIKKKN